MTPVQTLIMVDRLTKDIKSGSWLTTRGLAEYLIRTGWVTDYPNGVKADV